MVAVSHAPSPESNPDSPLPVISTVGIVTNRRNLIGQTFERYVAGSRAMRSAESYPDSPKVDGATPCERRPIGFGLIKALFPAKGRSFKVHVLALELLQLSK